MDRLKELQGQWEKKVKPQLGKIYFVWAAIESDDFYLYRTAEYSNEIDWGMSEALLDGGRALRGFGDILLNGQ